MIYILNFNNSRELSDIVGFYNNYGGTNINFLLEDFKVGKSNWSVPKNAAPNDIAIFMCAKSARANLGLATSHIPADYSFEFKSFVDWQKMLYKKYSGYLLGVGKVASTPTKDSDSNRWMADIDQLTAFTNPIYIDELRSFISISKTNSITYLNNEQWERLKWIVNQKNPGFFQNVIPPDIKILEEEFQILVQKESKKSLDQLKKEIKKKASIPAVSIVNTKVYYRSPTIAAYVKKRANGYCQLCGMKAPFNDQNGDPYLECHHIHWLSKGGMDSVDNCAALCPNCHRKMHIMNDLNDINTLKSKTY